MPIRFALPFQGDCWGRTVTHRVAVGCYALPLQGGGKLAILLRWRDRGLKFRRDFSKIN
ncbi:MAG: hypothetical protein LBL62_03245 [Planctomycetaceae bacterium]|nr:hypothetical protein [Planctomycetaceae bacterium]